MLQQLGLCVLFQVSAACDKTGGAMPHCTFRESGGGWTVWYGNQSGFSAEARHTSFHFSG